MNTIRDDAGCDWPGHVHENARVWGRGLEGRARRGAAVREGRSQPQRVFAPRRAAVQEGRGREGRYERGCKPGGVPCCVRRCTAVCGAWCIVYFGVDKGGERGGTEDG